MQLLTHDHPITLSSLELPLLKLIPRFVATRGILSPSRLVTCATNTTIVSTYGHQRPVLIRGEDAAQIYT